MKKNIYINTGETLVRNPEGAKENSSKFLSVINNMSKSITTNESNTAFTSPFNTIGTKTQRIKFIPHNKPFLKSKSNSKYSTLNILTGNSQSNNNIFLPKIKSNTLNNQLFTNADNIVSERKKTYIGRILKQTKSNLLEKSKAICLNNFLITQLKEKRDEINKKQIKIFTQLSNSEKRFEIDYKNFIDFVEEINQREKEEEHMLHNFKNQAKNIENNLNEQITINKSLESQIENAVKQIILLQAYASFLHKVFYRHFIFDEIKNMDLRGKKYLFVSDKIVSLYDKNRKTLNENNDIISDVESLMDKYDYFEEKLVNIIKEKEILEEELKKARLNYKTILTQLEERKKNCEYEFIKLKKDKNKINFMINESLLFDENKNNDTEKYIEYLIELGHELKIYTSSKKKSSNDINILECSSLCQKIVQILCEKENVINENINNIENIINNGDQKDREIIEKLIYERKKNNKREKQMSLINLQKMEEIKKRLKTVEKAKRIVVGGRKVFPDVPWHKHRNRKIKEDKSSECEDFEYLNYSNEKDD